MPAARGWRRFVLARDAAAIEYPHPRDRTSNVRTHERNQAIILRKHMRPLVEAATVCRARVLDQRWHELTDALGRRRLSCGASVDVCVEPDAELFALARPRVAALPLFGFRTLLADNSFDECLLAPSGALLSGLGGRTVGSGGQPDRAAGDASQRSVTS